MQNKTEEQVCLESIVGNLQRLAEIKKCSVNAILEQLKTRFASKSVTKEDLESKNYTYVQVFCYWKNLRDFEGFYFLVLGRKKDEAKIRAQRYMQGLGADKTTTKKIEYHLYPGNYIKNSRRLFEEGKYL